MFPLSPEELRRRFDIIGIIPRPYNVETEDFAELLFNELNWPGVSPAVLHCVPQPWDVVGSLVSRDVTFTTSTIIPYVKRGDKDMTTFDVVAFLRTQLIKQLGDNIFAQAIKETLSWHSLGAKPLYIFPDLTHFRFYQLMCDVCEPERILLINHGTVPIDEIEWYPEGEFAGLKSTIINTADIPAIVKSPL